MMAKSAMQRTRMAGLLLATAHPIPLLLQLAARLGVAVAEALEREVVAVSRPVLRRSPRMTEMLRLLARREQIVQVVAAHVAEVVVQEATAAAARASRNQQPPVPDCTEEIGTVSQTHKKLQMHLGGQAQGNGTVLVVTPGGMAGMTVVHSGGAVENKHGVETAGGKGIASKDLQKAKVQPRAQAVVLGAVLPAAVVLLARTVMLRRLVSQKVVAVAPTGQAEMAKAIIVVPMINIEMRLKEMKMCKKEGMSM